MEILFNNDNHWNKTQDNVTSKYFLILLQFFFFFKNWIKNMLQED